MKKAFFTPRSKAMQYLISTALVLAVASLCFILREHITYHITAVLLLLVVSLVATLFDIYPVLAAATLSALLLNFFFIHPLYTLHIKTPEDLLMLLIYFVIAVVNAVFTFRIRREEKKNMEKEERKNTIKLYNTLFNSLSHELKTPIATIIGAVDTLKESDFLTDANKQVLLSQIDTAGLRLNRQVENLLNMSRLENGMLKVHRDWCDCNELLHSVLQSVGNSDSHTIIFHENDSLPLLKIDAGLVQQAVYNILYNALIYTPPGASISLSITYSNEYCNITIADNGPGFPVDSLPLVFDKFYRLPLSKAGGTGLGLSIAKGFIEAHGGTISVENVVTGGAVFRLCLPAESNYLNKLKNE
jgi:two-component system sensor histidine kinase KdpD